MSISTTTSRNNYTGNGTADTFAYSFRILDEGDLLVTVRDSVGTETPLVLSTDYTVTGVGESSGSIVLVNASQDWLDVDGDLDSGWEMSIVRNVALTQPTDIRNQGTFYPETHEDAFDRIVMQNQQQQDEINRGVRLPVTVDPSTFDPEIPAAVVGEAGAILQVNSDGDGWTVGASTVVGTTVTPFMETVLDDLNAAAARTTLGFSGASGTVATANIEDLAVTTAKLAANAVTTAKITDANVTLAKLAEAAIADLALSCGASAVGSDAYAVNPSPAFTAYTSDMTIIFRADVANSGGATLNVNSLGAKTLKDASGNALVTGSIRAGQVVVAVYDGTDFKCPGIRVPIQNEVWMHTGNGHGATNTKIRRFTTATTNTGTAITYADSANDGATFTINESGNYAIFYTEESQVNTWTIGVSVNSNQLTTNVESITTAHRVAYQTSGVNLGTTPLAVTLFLAAGDVVRAHTNGSPTGASVLTNFRITRVS